MKYLLWSYLKSILLLFTFSFFLCLKAHPQNLRLADSLKNVVATAKDDTNKVKLLIEIGYQYRNAIPDTALYYYNEALEIAEKIEAKIFIAVSLMCIGFIHQIKYSYDNSIEYTQRALKISEELGDKRRIYYCLDQMGRIYYYQGLYYKAIEYHLKSLKIAEEIDDKDGLQRSYSSLGIIYFNQGSYGESIGYYLKSLKINEELSSKSGMARDYLNIGLIQFYQKSYDKAIEYFQKALQLNEELGDKRGEAYCYANFGLIYDAQGSNDKAIEYYTDAYKLAEELGIKDLISSCDNAFGEIYLEQGSFDKAREHYLKALKISEEAGDKNKVTGIGLSIANLNILLADSVAITQDQRLNYLKQAIIYSSKSIANSKEMKSLDETREAARLLMTAYNKLGNYKKAIEFAQTLIETQDSLFTEDKTRVIQEMSTKYETEKKQQQIELQESQLITKDVRIKQQKTFRNALIGGLCAIGLIVIVIGYAYTQKRKDNKKITEQNEKIIEANEELKRLNEITNQQKDEIVSSIQYAQRIQSAILPPETYITELLNENFIFYKPKDIVSGDFYWIKQVKHYIILVSADCTGHGVPGAFMSLLGISYLNEIVGRREVTQANQVLNELRKEIKHSLRQTGKKEESRDGIDIALCVIDTKKNIMEYSGAYSPLYIISNNNGESVFKVYKADMMPVGVHFSGDISFTNHEIPLEIGDTFYLSTDGLIDQMGGPNNTKFSTKNFKQLLLDIHNQPMYEQKEILEQTLKEWMGEHPQRDDILVIGARV